MKKIISAFLISTILVLSLGFSVFATTTDIEDIPYESYTYWEGLYDGSRKAVQVKQMFQMRDVVYPSNMGVADIQRFVDLCCDKSGKIYLLDSKGSKIVVLNKDLSFNSIISQIVSANGEVISFEGSEGIFVDKNDFIYIAGGASECVWKVDINGLIHKKYLLPDSNIIPTNFKFHPIKVTVDSRGYVYILSDGSYYGAILYSPKDEFLGFYGANTVTSTVTQAIKQVFNRLFTNDVKKSQSLKALPYQFTDLVTDDSNFIYTATGATDGSAKGQIKRLNPGGKNVFNSSDINYGDEKASVDYYGFWVGNNLSRIAISGDYIYALSTSYGKVFVYNTNNEMLCAFGGGITDGNQKGTFVSATSIEAYNDLIFVLDSEKNSLTVFEPTDYGKLVKSASSKAIRSDYLGSKEQWSKILMEDQNLQLAYKYLAKSAYAEEDYVSAMKYSKAGADRQIYDQACEIYRNDFIRNNFILIAVIVLFLIALIIVLIVFIKKKKIKLIKNRKTKLIFSVLTHPFDSFSEIKYKKQGSILISLILLFLYFVSEVTKTTRGGFIYTFFDPSSFNALFVLGKTVGLIVLWTVVNWAVTTLFGGIGKMKEIFIVVCYSLLPMIIGNIISIVATNVLVSSESAFLSVALKILSLYFFFLLSIGTIIVHDLSFSKFLGTTLLTLLGMAIVVFVGFLVWMIIQQMFGFIATLINEIVYR